MDFCRAQDRPHGIFKENGLNIKPFQHEDIEKWQHTFTGIQYHDEEHNFLLYGGVDDIMIDENDLVRKKNLSREISMYENKFCGVLRKGKLNKIENCDIAACRLTVTDHK